jgi:O-antigen/teichoic acid export membrane protein
LTFKDRDTISFNKFAKEVSIIGSTEIICGTVLLFVSLPLITKNIDLNKYGIWTQILVTVSLLTPIVLLGLSQSLIRYLASEKNAERTREYFFSSLLFVIIWGLVVTVAVFFSADYLALTIFNDPNSSIYIKFGSLLIVLTAVAQLPILYFRIFQLIKIYSLLRFLEMGVNLFLIFVFLRLNLDLFGIIFASILTNLVIFTISMIVIILKIGISIPKFCELKTLLIYGIPLTPNPMIEWLRNSSDRYIIGLVLGISAVGIYSASYAIGSIIIVIVRPLQLILFPFLSKMFDEGKIDEIPIYLEYSMKYFLMITIPAAIGISVLGLPLLKILTTEDFIFGAFLIPFIAIGGIFFGIYQISINITQLVKITKYNFYLYAIAATINFLLNFMLIPYFGLIGAAISALISFIGLAILSLHLSFKYLKFNFDLKFIIKCVFSAIVMAILIYQIHPTSMSDILISILVGSILYFSIIFLLKGVKENEILFFKQLIYLKQNNEN